MKRRRTSVTLVTRSHGDSGRTTAPIWPESSWRCSNSGRTGGVSARSAMTDLLIRPLVLDAVGEQHRVDAPGQLDEARALLLGVAELVAVELGLDAARVRAQHQDARADDDRLLDRVGDEQHRETRVI